jgi:hypothetical protein
MLQVLGGRLYFWDDIRDVRLVERGARRHRVSEPGKPEAEPRRDRGPASASCTRKNNSFLGEDNPMSHSKLFNHTVCKIACGSLIVATLFLTTVTGLNSQEDRKVETIDSTATGTSTQLGTMVNVKVTIYQYSTEEDRAVLVDAFKKGQNQGLVDALGKMKSVGRIAITGTVGQDLAYIRLIQSDTSRRIRFVTNRQIQFGEAYHNTQSKAYNLTAGEFILDNSDKDKSVGVLYPASQLIINKEGQLEFQLRKNHWNLVNIIDWNKAGAPK